MSTDPGQAQQVLRVALVTPLVYGVAVWMAAPLPFVAAMLFATFTLKMPAPPPFAVVVVLALLLALLPLAFAGIAGVLSQYPYLMVGFVGLVLFHAFRLQAVPKTAKPMPSKVYGHWTFVFARSGTTRAVASATA